MSPTVDPKVKLSAADPANDSLDGCDEAGRPSPVTDRKTILVFSAELLPASQTFVRDHVENIRDFDAVLLGVHKVNGLALDGISTAVLPPSRVGRVILWAFGLSPFLDKIVLNRDVVAIHAHFADAGMRIARYARRKKLPLIVTLHGADVLRRRKGSIVAKLFFGYLRREMLRSATQFLAVSDFIKQAALTAGYPAARVRRQALGIPLPEYLPPTAKRPDRNPPNILFVGRLVEKKGLTYLLQACRRLAEDGFRFTLTIIGDGPLAAQHRQEAEGMPAIVLFLGARSPSQVWEELNTAEIFCMPSTEAADGDNEGLGHVCLEAQAAGVPVVAFAQGPVPEAVVDGKTALLARDKSVDGLADALKALLADPALRRRMGAAGRSFVLGNFDIRDRSRELDEIYKLATAGALHA
jgi:glycosyltransferase involved in cell wall biosynthesis